MSIKEVRVTAEHIKFLGNPILVNMHVLRELRDKGIPALGVCVLTGVSRGRLEITSSDEGLTYRWHSNCTVYAEQAKKAKPYDPLNDDEDESL